MKKHFQDCFRWQNSYGLDPAIRIKCICNFLENAYWQGRQDEALGGEQLEHYINCDSTKSCTCGTRTIANPQEEQE